LIWNVYDEDVLVRLDHELWSVFSGLTSVRKLDLAALPQDEHDKPHVNQFPSVLFPAVTKLRLLGWMQHKLVANTLDSVNLSNLKILDLDTLQEEGNLPDGSAMSEGVNRTT
jgi:hypothetical protein